MKKISLFLAAGIIVLMTGCNNNQPEKTGNKVQRDKGDSLFEVVNEGHIVAMDKMGALERAMGKAKKLADSISKLPAKAQEAAAPLKARVNNLIGDLKNADSLMYKWMDEFNVSLAKDSSLQQRVDYLLSEEGKVNEMKNAVLNSLKKADSVLKEKL